MWHLHNIYKVAFVIWRYGSFNHLMNLAILDRKEKYEQVKVTKDVKTENILQLKPCGRIRENNK